MGMFDEVSAKCPDCGDEVLFQSKAGECTLHRYDLENVPADIAYDVIGSSAYCKNCNKSVTMQGSICVHLRVER